MNIKPLIFVLQTFWIFLCGGFMWSLSRLAVDSYWLSVPLFMVMWLIGGWLGISLIGLCDPDIRLANKLGIKIENLQIYRDAFERLVEMEAQGIDTHWIGDELPNSGEWLRYLKYEIARGLYGQAGHKNSCRK